VCVRLGVGGAAPGVLPGFGGPEQAGAGRRGEVGLGLDQSQDQRVLQRQLQRVRELEDDVRRRDLLAAAEFGAVQTRA
jgi:hypothetical protein